MAVKIICTTVMFAAFLANIAYYIIELKRLPAYYSYLKAESDQYEGTEAWQHGGKKIGYVYLRMIGVSFALMLVSIAMFALSGHSDPEELYLAVPFLIWIIVTVVVTIVIGIILKVILKKSGLNKYSPDDFKIEKGIISNYYKFRNLRAANRAEFATAAFIGMFFGVTCGLVAYAITIIVML